MPEGCEPALIARGVQMLLEEFRPTKLEHAAIDLGAADIDDMVELANLTKPGPFLPGTSRLGGFVGIRVDGRLAAMVGERLKLGSHTEVSAVCTHPDFRGRGMAAQLSSLVVERILARGERPFLHAFADNHQAIRLYESAGICQALRHECPGAGAARSPSGDIAAAARALRPAGARGCAWG